MVENTNTNILLKIWYLYYRWAGIWKVHQIGMRNEYLEETAISKSERAIDSRREILWELVDDLVMIFDMADPLSHQIFKDLKPPEIHEEGYKRLLACYENGLKRMQIIYKQDVI